MSAVQGRLTVGVVFGGPSTEHTVSVRSARTVLAAMDRERFQPLPFGVTPDGVWLRPAESESALAAMAAGAPEIVSGAGGRGVLARPQALEALAECDIVFPVIHGRGGEDGRIQGLLELADLPYVGAGVAASAMGMDKALMKSRFREAGLSTPPYRVVSAQTWRRDPVAAAHALDDLDYPRFVKPARGGSSIATHKVHSNGELEAALLDAFRIDSKALVEQAIACREIECGVLGNAEPAASPVGEVRYQREFYDYVAKYEDSGTELIVPAALPEDVSERIQSMALAAYGAIDCAGMARVDFYLEESGTVWVSEINTIPGFTSASMFPRAWEAGGIPNRDLVTRLLDLGLERHREQEHRGTWA